MSNPKKQETEMKKIFAMGLMLVALALTNCAKNNEVAVVEENNINLYANVDARTTNNGLSTAWASSDALTVFYAVNGATTYSANTKFTVADAATGHFTGSATLAADTNYDWYAFYPYNTFMTDPKGSKGYFEVGAKAGASQTQKGNNSMAHIAGAYYPLTGKALNVASDEAPVLTMSHATSLIEFEVTNSLDKDIFIESIAFTSSEDINGTYYFNWAGDEVVLTGSGAGYVSATATLNVSNATAITAGAKATFYLAVKPHTVAAGSTLGLMLTANDGTNSATLEKSITTSAASTFAAGTIKTIPVNYNTPIEAEVVKVGKYVKLTEAPADWTGKYLIIMSDKKIHSAISGKDFIAQCTTFYDPASVTEIPSADVDAYAMTVAASTTAGKYTMKYPDGKYFGITAKNSSGAVTTPMDITLEYTASGVKMSLVLSGTTYYLYSNTSNASTPYFRCYTLKNQSNYSLPTFYKFVEE